MKRPRHVMSNIRFFLEFIELDEEAIVSSWARIAELRRYRYTAMSSSFLWFVISMLVALSGSERLMGGRKPWRVKRVEMALAYPTLLRHIDHPS